MLLLIDTLTPFTRLADTTSPRRALFTRFMRGELSRDIRHRMPADISMLHACRQGQRIRDNRMNDGRYTGVWRRCCATFRRRWRYVAPRCQRCFDDVALCALLLRSSGRQPHYADEIRALKTRYRTRHDAPSRYAICAAIAAAICRCYAT